MAEVGAPSSMVATLMPLDVLDTLKSPAVGCDDAAVAYPAPARRTAELAAAPASPSPRPLLLAIRIVDAIVQMQSAEWTEMWCFYLCDDVDEEE